MNIGDAVNLAFLFIVLFLAGAWLIQEMKGY
jgi:hypothetical protein